MNEIIPLMDYFLIGLYIWILYPKPIALPVITGIFHRIEYFKNIPSDLFWSLPVLILFWPIMISINLIILLFGIHKNE